MNTHADKTQENKSQSLANGLSKIQNIGESTFQFVDNRPEGIAQRKLQEMTNNSPRAIQLKALQEMANNSPHQGEAVQLQAKADNYSSQQPPIQKKERILDNSSLISINTTSNPTLQRVKTKSKVIQRLVGAALLAGHDEFLPDVAADRGAAAAKIAKYINLRARETAAAVPDVPTVHATSSVLGANNPGNLYVQSNYRNGADAASSLETWSELTDVGGGYVKRVRIIESGNTIMDRVMNDPAPTALNNALVENAAIGAFGPIANRQYGSVHGVAGGDAAALNIVGHGDREADNITKIVGEGARFGWLADGLSNGTFGNTSTGIFNVSVKIPQEGTLTMNPTFQQLWGAWDSAFGKSYMKNKNTAKIILKQRLVQGLRTRREDDLLGMAPLESGVAAGGQVTSLLRAGGGIALMSYPEGGIDGAKIIERLGMTWTSER